jgi:hypothetical protein
MKTTNNKNTQYTDKYFFINRIKKINDSGIKIDLNQKINAFLSAVKIKHT